MPSSEDNNIKPEESYGGFQPTDDDKSFLMKPDDEIVEEEQEAVTQDKSMDIEEETAEEIPEIKTDNTANVWDLFDKSPSGEIINNTEVKTEIAATETGESPEIAKQQGEIPLDTEIEKNEENIPIEQET